MANVPWSAPKPANAVTRRVAWLNRGLRIATRPETAWLVFGGVLLAIYAFIPAVLALTGYPDQAYRTLASIATLGVFVMWGVYLLSNGLNFKIPQITVDTNLFLTVVIGIFVGFAMLSWATAERIPLIAALQGADGETLAYLRESFLKGRGGWQSGFVYVNAILSGALLPYCIAIMFVTGNRYKWWVFAFFMFYSVSFVEKAFFLKAIVPVFYLLCQQRFRSRIQPSYIAIATVLLLLLFTVVSRAGVSGWSVGGGEFWSPTYQAGNALDQLAWRAISVPLFSAVDAIKVYETFFGYPLMGATSSLLSLVSGAERIEFERMVFAFEWGQNDTGTGSANSVYLTEAFINYGWWGVIVFSAVVGLCLRVFASSRDEGVRSLWLLFVFNLFSAGLIGLLFSNGFILLLMLAVFVRLRGVPLIGALDDAPPPAVGRRRMPWEG
jgi:hypothetical protein